MIESKDVQTAAAEAPVWRGRVIGHHSLYAGGGMSARAGLAHAQAPGARGRHDLAARAAPFHRLSGEGRPLGVGLLSGLSTLDSKW